MSQRPANFGTSQWFHSLDLRTGGWKIDAACGAHPELPWTGYKVNGARDELPPNENARWKMRAICDNCPVRRRCAQYALGLDDSDGTAAAGGFYAGVWLPYSKTEGRGMHGRARRALLAVAARLP